VSVQGQILAGKAHVDGGEAVVVLIPPPRKTDLVPQDLPLDLLFEDEALLIVNKPSGLTVHPGAGQRDGTLANALAFHMRNLPELGGSDRPGIVHRLDKDTSGVMVVAKTEAAMRALSAAFAERTVLKTYLACTHGQPRDATGQVDAPIGRKPNHRTKMAIREGGRASTTRWKVLERMPRHGLVRCQPRTGRTHQIRVHLQHLGHPVVGDRLYGRPGQAGEELTTRLLLHAHHLDIPHPLTGERVAFDAPLPPEFERSLEGMRLLDLPRRER
jgi:23S rRNA pseudouridine1911/1915/1917 synthase